MSLSQNVVAAVKMWKSWGDDNNNEIDPKIAEPDIPSFDLTQLWPDVLDKMRAKGVPATVEAAATKVHPTPTDLAGGVNSMQMWDWYFFWLGIFQDPTNAANEALNDADMYEDLQQYTCKVISEWMNLKYGVCILAGTTQGRVFTGPRRNLVDRLAWSSRLDLPVQFFKFREIFLHATNNPAIRKYVYPDLVDAVKTDLDTPIILQAHTASNPATTKPAKKPDPPKKKPDDPTPDSGGGMGILFIVLLLLAAAVTFSKK